MLYILKQLFTSVSVNGGGYLPSRYSPPLRRIIVKYCSHYTLVCEATLSAACIREKLMRHGSVIIKKKVSRPINHTAYLLCHHCRIPADRKMVLPQKWTQREPSLASFSVATIWWKMIKFILIIVECTLLGSVHFNIASSKRSSHPCVHSGTGYWVLHILLCTLHS